MKKSENILIFPADYFVGVKQFSNFFYPDGFHYTCHNFDISIKAEKSPLPCTVVYYGGLTLQY